MAKKALLLVLRVAAWFAFLPYVGILLLVLSGSPTWSGVAYLAGIGLLITSLMVRPFARRLPRGLARGAAVAIVAVACVRGCTAGAGDTLTFSPGARLVDRLVDERDLALSGTRVLVAGGMVHDDRAALPGAMRTAYEEMTADQGDVPSPVFATYLGMQSPDAYDLILIAPKDVPEPTEAIIFLHGYAGNFTLPCWQVAQAVGSLHVLTACPSTRWVGDWASRNGEATLRKTVDALHGRGVTKIVLAGLSNGGYGASQLAPKMRGSFVGLVLISGATPQAGAPGVPTLLIHGRQDSIAAFQSSSAYVAGHPGAKLVALDAGHFAMLVQRDATNRALNRFVADVLGRPTLTALARPSP